MPPAAFSADNSQILIPESFLVLHLTGDRRKTTLSQRELAGRYELCEDIAQMLCEPAAAQQFQLGITEDLVLEHCLQGLLATPDSVSEAQARWVVCRLAELLNWPQPEWASQRPSQGDSY